MKVKPALIEQFLRSTDPAVHTILFYGPDAGLISERSRNLQQTWLGSDNDPFALSELKPEQLQESPGRLAEEVQALTLTGGNRVVLLQGATDVVSRSLQATLKIEAPVARTIVEAGELAPGSRLRKLVEKSEFAAAIPCYRDEKQQVASLVQQQLNESGLKTTREALEYLVAHLGEDRSVTRNEISKLIVFAGEGASGTIGLSEVEAVIGDSSALEADKVSRAVFTRDCAGLNHSLNRMFAEAQSPVLIVRSCLRFARQILTLQLEVDAGMQPGTAIQAARPPIHFRSRPAIQQALRSWPTSSLIKAIESLVAMEIECKTTGANDRLALRDGLIRLMTRGR